MKTVWITDPDTAFLKVELRGEDQVCMPDGTLKTLAKHEIFQVNPAQFDRANDIAELTFLNEASVVNNLATRYLHDEIYTYSGLFLVAVNPYKQLKIYGRDTIDQFKGKAREEAPPHIYAVAEAAFRRMLETHENQSILITGESGAGKTENTKKTIQYLSAVTAGTSSNTDQRILQTNPVLEAFGNAQTIRNNNSSRFGKFIRIEFGKSNKISGASIDWYLLEKSRVITQNPLERNYHIFYYLIKGADDERRKLLGLTSQDPLQYAYLKGGAPVIEGIDDAAELTKLTQALTAVGFDAQELENVFRMVAAVLLLGDIEVAAQSVDVGRLPNMNQVRRVCKLLGVKEDTFAGVLTKPKIKAGRELVAKTTSAAQIRNSINALAMSLYERLFGYIVERLNTMLLPASGSGKAATNFIGVLDIAGFEIFESNSFEQLCINYTNEKLQQFFNHHMFVLEQAEYVKEEIEWDYVDYGSDLQPTIDLIERANPMGIFSCLDEDCVMPRSTDKSFTEKLNGKWHGKPKFAPARLNQGFVVSHYAGKVEYSTDGWLEKNKDPLNEQLVELLAAGSNQLAARLFGDASEAAAVVPAPKSPTKSPTKSGKIRKGIFRTVAQRHREQLDGLMDQLNATHPHFVRCIVPNSHKAPGQFDNKLVLEQLRCNGVLEGIRIARSGFPNRVEFDDFCARYHALVPMRHTTDTKAACETILKGLQLNPSSFKIGATKVFFKNGVLAELEDLRDQLLLSQALKVQALARGFLGRKSYQRAIFRAQASKTLAKTARIWLAHKDDQWWKLAQAMRPLLANNESMENNRKELKIQKLQDNLAKTRTQYELLESSLKQQAQTAKQLEAAVEEKTGLVTTLKKEAKAATEALASHKQQHSEALEGIKAAHRTVTDKLAFEIKKRDDELAALKKQHAETTYKLEESTKGMASTAKALSETKAEHQQLTALHAELQTSHETLTQTNERADQYARTTKQELKAATAACAALEKQLAETEGQLKTARSELATAQVKLQTATQKAADTAALETKMAALEKQAELSKQQFSQRLKEMVAKQEQADRDNKKLKSAALDSDCATDKYAKELKVLTAAIAAAGFTAATLPNKDTIERLKRERDEQSAKAANAAKRDEQNAREAKQRELDLKQRDATIAELRAQLKSEADQRLSLQSAQLAAESAKGERQQHEQRLQALGKQVDELQGELKQRQTLNEKLQGELKQHQGLREKLVAALENVKKMELENAQLLKAAGEYASTTVATSTAASERSTASPSLSMRSPHSTSSAPTTPSSLDSPDLRKLESENKLLRLKMVQLDRTHKVALSNAHGNDGDELLKERDSVVRQLKHAKAELEQYKTRVVSSNVTPVDTLTIQKRRPLRNISNETPASDKRLSSYATRQIAELNDDLQEEKESSELYRQRAVEYQTKMERAQVILQSLQTSENELLAQIEGLKKHQLSQKEISSRELALCNDKIKRLSAEIAAASDLTKSTNQETERQAMHKISVLSESLDQVTIERNNLLHDKMKLEQRLRYGWLGESDPVENRKEELQRELRRNRRDFSSTKLELEELRRESELNQRRSAQYEEQLEAAERRNEMQAQELDRLRDETYEVQLRLKQANREVNAVREENLRYRARGSGASAAAGRAGQNSAFI